VFSELSPDEMFPTGVGWASRDRRRDSAVIQTSAHLVSPTPASPARGDVSVGPSDHATDRAPCRSDS
jgi:hypothetical protein